MDDTLKVRSSDLPLDLIAASRDLWPGGTLDMWQGRFSPQPERVFWPRDEAEVLAVLQHAAATGRAVVPYGAGSGVCGGARGMADSIVLDLKGLDRIGPIDEERWTVEAEAGVNGQHLEDWLAARGWTLGHSPSSIWCSTVGGWAAARGAGQFSSRYGVFEDMVLQLRAVAPGRGAFTVGEEGDAPAEWLPLLLGSEGTLAAITRVRMRIWPAPRARVFRGFRFADVPTVITAMRQLMQGELWPSVLRMYDPVDTRIGGKTKPKTESGNRGFLRGLLEQADRLDGLRRRSLTLPLSLPGLVNRVFQQMASDSLLIVGWEGDPEVVEAASSAGLELLRNLGEDLGEEPGQRWFASRHAVSYKLMPIFERGGFVDTMEVACRWSQLEPVYTAVREALGRTAVVMAHMSHLYPEGGSIYFSFAGRGDASVYQATWDAALEAVIGAGGTVTHHHGVGSLKAAAASAEVGPAIAGWRALKSELDPQGVLNPGRLFVDVPHREPHPLAPLLESEGVVRVSASSSLEERRSAVDSGELSWPWERIEGLPRWQRCWWQTGWQEVRGELAGLGCRLGRGPRSAAGPDLRSWLVDHGSEVSVTVPSAPEGDRWMGRARLANPWSIGRALLRSDLRPAVLTVEDGWLLVGFRGPAARALGAVAASRVEGGLEEIPWRIVPLPGGPLEACALEDTEAIWVNLSGAYRRST